MAIAPIRVADFGKKLLPGDIETVRRDKTVIQKWFLSK
jgi:hypothetical protein